MTVANLLDELVTQLDTIDGLRPYDRLPDKVAPPAAVLAVESVEYHVDFDLGQRVVVSVDIIGSRADARTGQDAMHRYYSEPVTTAIEAGSYTDYDVVVRSAGPIGTVEVGGTSYYAIQFTVEAIGVTGSGGGGGG